MARRLVTQSISFISADGAKPHQETDPLLSVTHPVYGETVHGVTSLERQVTEAPLDEIVLRYGSLYGPGTGFDKSIAPGSVHVDAAAKGAELAVTKGQRGSSIRLMHGAIPKAIVITNTASTFRAALSNSSTPFSSPLFLYQLSIVLYNVPIMTNRSYGRRIFLKAAAGAGQGTPLLLPAGVRSANERPSDRITVGAISLGGVGSGNLGGILCFGGCRVLTDCDVDKKTSNRPGSGSTSNTATRIVPHTRISENWSPGTISTSFRWDPPTNGMRSLPSPPPKPARTSMERSRSATTSRKAAQ
jgi:hypothetical protein